MIPEEINIFLVLGQNIWSLQIIIVGKWTWSMGGEVTSISKLEEKNLDWKKEFLLFLLQNNKEPWHMSTPRRNSLSLMLKTPCCRSVFIPPYDYPINRGSLREAESLLMQEAHILLLHCVVSWRNAECNEVWRDWQWRRNSIQGLWGTKMCNMKICKVLPMTCLWYLI